jgi:hypothetical protein
MRSDINRTKTSETLRTSGRLTGNFGKSKVKANPGVYEVSKKTLTLDDIKIVNPKEYYGRIAIAYKQTNDPKLKRTLLDILKSRVATVRR